MRLISLTLLAGVLALGATAIGEAPLFNSRASQSSEVEYLAQNDNRNTTVHRGSGRRQILAVTVSPSR